MRANRLLGAAILRLSEDGATLTLSGDGTIAVRTRCPDGAL
jgi:hypothetical protein